MNSKKQKWIAIGLGATLVIAALGTGGAYVVREYGREGTAQESAIVFAPNPNSRQYGTDDQIALLQARLKKDSEDFEANLALSLQYLQKVRETGDPSLYSKVEKLLDVAAKSGSKNPDYFAARATLDLSRHNFASALDWATQAVTADPERARYHGVQADALIELGQYDKAIEALQQMVDRRPEFSAYARIAYARELYGDPEGAVEAFTLAIDAGSSIPENLSWGYVQRGHLEFAMNHSDRALADYESALTTLPGYPPALAGKARLAAAAGRTDEAIALYTTAFDRTPLAEYAISLGELYSATGNALAAAKQFDLVRAIDKLQSQNGVNTDLEIALFLADHGSDPSAAVARARDAYRERPNVNAADALGWSLYQSGQYAEAEKYSTEALRLGTRDSLKLFHAGMIAKATGTQDKAREYLFDALRFNPSFSLIYSATAKETLTTLGGNLPAAALAVR